MVENLRGLNVAAGEQDPTGNTLPRFASSSPLATVHRSMLEVPVVSIVDDDEAVRETLRHLVESINVRVKTYASPQHYLDACDPNRPGCLVLDIRMPGMSGLDLHETLIGKGIMLPVIMITGYGDVSSAVRAMRQGAVDFLEKPFHNQTLLDLVQACIRRDAQHRQAEAARQNVRSNLLTLTPRERDVLDLVVSGKSNKETARTLEISPKTVEIHRSRVMEKMAATSLAELVQMIGILEDYQGHS